MEGSHSEVASVVEIYIYEFAKKSRPTEILILLDWPAKYLLACV